MVDKGKTQTVMNNKGMGIAWVLGKQCEWPTVYHSPHPDVTFQIQQM